MQVRLSDHTRWSTTTANSAGAVTASTLRLACLHTADGVHAGSLLISSSLGDVTDQADVDGVSARLGSQAGDANYHYRYDLNRDGVIDSQDVVLVTACVTGETPDYRLYLPTTIR